MTTKPHMLSIQTDAGTYQHHLHQGTMEGTACLIAEEVYHAQCPSQGTRIISVGLMLNSELADTYDGTWSSETRFLDEDDRRAVVH